MNALRKAAPQDVEPVIMKRGLCLVRGSGTHRPRGDQTRRDGRIRLVKDTPAAQAVTAVSRPVDNPTVIDAHNRLRLPSLEKWLAGHVW